MSGFRKPMSKKGSQKLFKSKAKKVHPKNHYSPMRGGIRL